MKGTRKYRIIKSTLGYNISRERDAEIWFLGANKWVLEKRYAKTFYTEDDAKWHLVLARMKWEKIETESNSINEVGLRKGEVRNSWSELW